jgi:hypothetical protein
MLARTSGCWQAGPVLTLAQIEENMDIILIIAILLLIFGGVGSAVGFLGQVAWILIILAVIVIAWRLIAGRTV